MRNLAFALLSFAVVSCVPKKEPVDAIYYNAKIYTVDSTFRTFIGGVAIKDGKFIALDKNHLVLSEYDSDIKVDLNNKIMYPGLYDAHCHFLGYGLSLTSVDLRDTKSFEEVIQKVVDFRKNNPDLPWITGRGWDQNDWQVKKFPTNDTLSKLFPEVPIFIKRIDGHAGLANAKAIELAAFATDTLIEGGQIQKTDGQLTGVFIDNAMDLIDNAIPEPDNNQKAKALLLAQQNCFEVGLTTVDDAGLELEEVLLIDSLHRSGKLKINMYTMLNPGDKEFKYAKENGKVKTDRLNVRSFKIYADGALGSRGACLKNHYSDKEGHSGFLRTAKFDMQEYAKKIHELGFQMNTHCIGDSANKTLLHIYANQLGSNNDGRWRIEHAQVVDREDIGMFKEYNIIPSVQPTHCTSDMYWAEDRLGKDRIRNAYAYRSLLNEYGKIAAGSDFPVEQINPLFGFYAAISRKDQENYPDGGFYSEESISREQALKAMTIWAAYSNFEENEKGSIEVGKKANFVILEDDIMTLPENQIFSAKIFQTFISGECVFNSAP